MSGFILPKGTVVKFGTVSNNLYSFLRGGIPASMARDGLQAVDEHGNLIEDKNSGIYLGELMAYFSACAAFGKRSSEVHENNQIVLSRFVEVVRQSPRVKPDLPGLDAVAEQIGIPVVLEIVLEEDCEVRSDEHFESADNAEKSWKLWRSVVLNRPEGIPAAWIKKCHFPRLLDFRDLAEAKNTRMLEQTTDSALMVGGLMQSWHKDAPGDLLLAFKRQYGRTNFSQSFDFSENWLERFFNLQGMLDPATRIMNQMMIWQHVTALAKKQEIPLE